MGHLGRDAETRFTTTGKSITTFSVATEVGFGEQKRKVWINVKAWNQPASVQELRTGALVEVNGYIDVETWDDKEGKKQTRTVVNANMVSLPQWEKREGSGGRGDDALVSRPRGSSQGQQSRSAQQQQQSSAEITDDDVPF